MIRVRSMTVVMLVNGLIVLCEPVTAVPPRPGDPEWPMAWITYRQVNSLQEDIADLKAHGVGLMSWRGESSEHIKESIEIARHTGMKFHIHLPEITEHAGLVKRADLDPTMAVMIGGVYRGKAIDRHLFSFTAGKHEILIEPPVYNKGFAYTRRDEKFGHYFPDIGAPVRAEVIVPLKPFDGRQHLKVIPAAVGEAKADAELEIDSVTSDMPASSETDGRQLYELRFDLTGLEGAMLDQVGLAVYWDYHGYKDYWMFGQGTVSAWAPTTHDALRAEVRRLLAMWTEANGGSFPTDVVLAVRFGDECFYTTGHLNGPAVSYPLWDYSEPSVRAFRARAGDLAYPRTWGFPEIYGPDAYAWWLYNLHEGCAHLCGIVREEIARAAPGLRVFRNTTRMGVFHPSNDFDGSGQEVLAQNLDIIHFDPYPVGASGYKPVIPRDMNYGAGLARRYDRLLIPWMQAHTYAPGGLTDVSPAEVERMAAEHWSHGVDAIIWLGYGSTFPKSRPDSWDRAGRFHQKLAATPPVKPKARLAVLRPYRTWALSSQHAGRIRNPADWMLQQLLEVWAVQHGQPYDIFELSPGLSPSEQEQLNATLKDYPMIVSTVPFEGAMVIGADTEGTAVDPNTSQRVQRQFEKVLISQGWLKASADLPTVETSTRSDGMMADSPVTFPKQGALPAQYPPDVQQPSEPAEDGYYIFGSPCRSLAQIGRIQKEMPKGKFTPPPSDWTHLERARRVFIEGGELHLLAVGDSIVNDTMRSGWVAKLQEAYPKARIKATVYVRGGGGCQHYREQGRVAKNIVPRQPDIVFIGGISQKDIESIREVIHQLREGLPAVEILLATGTFGTTDPRDPEALARAPYSGTGWHGQLLKKLAGEERCAYLDMTTPWAQYVRSTGVHPHRFYRDAVHANEFGEQILSKILMAFFSPAEHAAVVPSAAMARP